MESFPLINWRAFFWSSFKMIVLLPVLLTPVAVSADHSDQHRINKVKAAFVLNIARFVTWPDHVFDDGHDAAGDDSAGKGYITLCYYRGNPFAAGLASITGRTVEGRPLRVKKIDNLSAAKSCQILLIPKPEQKNFNEEATPDLTSALLTIVDSTNETSESVNAIDSSKGVMISLIRKGSRIGFDIDASMSREANLKISSQLLKHARIVGEGS